MEIVKLYPECKDNIWGGVKLREKYGKKTDKAIVAESWELSFHKDGPTRLENGKTLQEVATAADLGKNCKDFPFFPTLIKFIDSKQDLSVQVHPSDDYALKNENSFGKTEMWYVVEAEQGAGLYVGFKRDVTKEEYERAIQENTLTELLNFYQVQAGDCYFIPSGTIHAIGSGCLITEIQQNSNLTNSIFEIVSKNFFYLVTRKISEVKHLQNLYLLACFSGNRISIYFKNFVNTASHSAKTQYCYTYHQSITPLQ